MLILLTEEFKALLLIAWIALFLNGIVSFQKTDSVLGFRGAVQAANIYAD